ncbi:MULTISPECIES: D-hexose-6-phosphate mutarotase [unclassified Marinobacterium]|uniref:D-hexose-6-phosphate mutarotase n=1 Tax=unclassified Marinobacterium TaxID=2644139 RepID=UPI001568898D|nr:MULTISPECIES: D-hexose-6-phosphate mutarotase [unclassified Marinobacterium]NRP16574.1 putative glucose-6-phosphate 1-epimerase [Marinobacterium sp. xm-a-152]NRP39192.1 putative glucose-6-phosphate 1-epimerase [Marinobacterium sp. xm-a-121]NRQ00021.1 putative glucose-6-phosphate 1-epimerase [Marinobacterium sp. xm-v-233]
MSIDITRFKEQLDAVQLTFKSDLAIISLSGGHILSYQSNGEERLWMSPKANLEAGKSIRGGIPVCWPWFGAHLSDESKPAHGFARTSIWTLVDAQDHEEFASVTLGLENSVANPLFPYDCSLAIKVTLTDKLSVELITTNLGNQPIEITQALHTYLPISDLDNARIAGLKGVDYADKLKGFARATEDRDSVDLKEPTDRVYFDDSNCLILNDKNQETRIYKQNSGTTVVWNPGKETAKNMADIGAENYRGFLCIEAANAMEDKVRIEPGESFTLRQGIYAA